MTITTSSRLDRGARLPPAVQAQEEAMDARAIACCREALDRSRFFGLLRDGAMTPPLMQYAFLQYRFWRDQLHKWFGLCILKAESCEDPDQKNVIMAMADHIFTDLRDGHDVMFVEMLHELGLGDAEIEASRPSPATVSYARSFRDDFGDETTDLYEAVAALSGRELCVAVRNVRLLEDYFDARHLARPTWLALHAELEVDHFHDAIGPVLARYHADPARMAGLMRSVARGIERHVQYFEDLLREHETR